MLDPLVIKLLSLAFALLLAAAAWHKLTDFVRFRGILVAYRLLPGALVTPAAGLFAVLEIGLAIAWALGWNPAATAAATAALLGVYTLAIGLNLFRGRIYIDCGCGFGSSGSGQQLSSRLLLRNALLIAAALAVALPSTARELLLIDYIGLAGACVVLALLYLGSNQLLLNAQAINSWRKPPAGSNRT